MGHRDHRKTEGKIQGHACHLRHHDHGHAFHVLLESLLMDNLLKYIDAGDSLSLELAGKVAVSKAKNPADHVISGKIRAYRSV